MAGDEQRPATFTPRAAWEAFDRLRDETREARHSQANLTARAIAEQGQIIRGELGALDARLRTIEHALAAAAPVSLGSRINELEMWRSKADGESTLVVRVNTIESALDQMRGSLMFLRWGATIVGLLSGLAALLSWVALQAPR